jgi:hypothetical protein
VPKSAAAASNYRSPRFEILENRLLLANDFGDAPSGYPTLLSENGARHSSAAATGPMLGSIRDIETDGNPSSSASGDDTLPAMGADDEDGVVFGTVRVGELGAVVMVTVSNAPDGARLDAWIDFNGDGNWDGALERIAATVLVQEGANQIEFDVPGDARPGATFARFRLSSSGGLGPRGVAADGEVEDHSLTIIPTPAALGAFGPQHTITSTAFSSGTDVIAVDLDRDGDLDVVSSSTTSPRFFIHENRGTTFATVIVNAAADIRDLQTADMDGDGDIDVVAASAASDTVAWYENLGGFTFAQHNISTTADFAKSIDVVDLDRDGDLDVLSASFNDDKIAWYENAGSAEFITHVVSTTVNAANRVFAQDINGDGHIDILTASEDDDKVRWWENNGQQVFTEHLIAGVANPNDLYSADLDADGDADVITAWEGNPYRVLIFENDGVGGFTKHDMAFQSPFSDIRLHAADLDGDGDFDVFSDLNTWYENRGGFNFVPVASGGGGTFAADMDADGDLDLLKAFGQFVAWYENVDTGVSVAAAQPTVDEDGGSPAIFTFTRRGLSLDPVTARYLFGGSAALGVDYNIVGATLVDGQWTVPFAAGETTADVSIVPLADDVLDPTETVQLTLVSSDDVAAELPVSATVTIVGTDRIDWGDLPSPYPTLSTANGPRHGATGPRLGATRDDEANGQPSASADGDDASGADEDGVTFGAIRVGMADASVTVNVQQAPAGARLTAWMDFDGDGNFGGVLERVISDAAVVEGDNSLTFQVPSGAVAGNTFARFRLRTAAGSLGPIGAALDGEVEDYMVAIAPPIASVGPGDFPHPVATTAFDTFAVDLDRDGDMDVVTTSGAIDSKISWYENDGTGGFTFHTVNTSAPSSMPTAIHAGDLDGDGDIDVVSGWQEGQIRIHSNQGNETFATTNLSVSGLGVADVFLADVDGNGRMDIVVANTGSVRIGYFQQTSANSFTFQSISTTSTNPGTVQAVDIDGDGDLDVLAVMNNRTQVFWYENQGTSPFVSHLILTATMGQFTALAVDLDRDGDMDVVTGSDRLTAVQWHENNSNQVFTPRTIKSGTHGTRSVNAADMDGDGDYDVLAGFFSTSGRCEWYKNDGQQNFTLQTIDATAQGSLQISPADFNGDGDLDVLVTLNSGTVWYENASNGVTLTSTTASVAEDSGTPVVFTFTRTGSLTQPLTVSFTVGGNATFGVDYTQSGADTFIASGGTVTFPAMSSTAQVTLTPLADSEFEDDETVTLAIAVGVPYAIYTPSTATTKLLDRSEGGDFGDAPAPYSTLRTQNGARHRAVGPMLGSARDTEFDGQPAPGANGDDASGADEDGVTFGGVRIGQLDAPATVHVQNAPAGARLDAWIDFDGDGNWGGPFEQIALSRPVVEGANLITFDVPSSARIGTTVARFRLSAAGSLFVHGWSADGEVEDHVLTIAAPVASAAVFNHPKVIGAGTNLYSSFSADVDNDGDMDVLADVLGNDQIVWYLNDGNQNFTPHVVGTSTLPVEALYAADLDRDGDLDVLAATGNSSVGGKIDWYENTGNLVFTAHIGPTADLRYVSIYAVDVDGDGDVDLVSGSQQGGSTPRIEWHENDGQQNFTAHSLISASSARAIHAGDVDRDGDIDIVSGSSSNGIVWHRNLGGGAFANQVLATGTQDPTSLSITDLDLDGDADIMFTLGPNASGLRWLEQVASGTFVQRNLVTFSPGTYSSVQTGDIDGDGDIDVVAGATWGIEYFKNIGQQQFVRTFTVSAAAPLYSLHLTDMDGDGDLDTLTTSDRGWAPTWYENLHATVPGDYDTSGTVNSSDWFLWRRSFGSTSDLLADGNGNGMIDAADYVVWRKNLGSTVLSQGQLAVSADDNQMAAAAITVTEAGNDTDASGERLDSRAARSADPTVLQTSHSIIGTVSVPRLHSANSIRAAQGLTSPTRMPRLNRRPAEQLNHEAFESGHDAALASWLESIRNRQETSNDSETFQSMKSDRLRERHESQFDAIDKVFTMLAEHWG